MISERGVDHSWRYTNLAKTVSNLSSLSNTTKAKASIVCAIKTLTGWKLSALGLVAPEFGTKVGSMELKMFVRL